MDVCDRARRYLAALPMAVSGQGGHDATFRAAGALVHGFDLDDGEALALLEEWNGTHCQPPWSTKDLEHKVRSSRAAGSNRARGYLLGSDSDGKRREMTAGGVARKPQRERASWIPPYDERRLREFVAVVPEVSPGWFEARSPIDPRRVKPGEFLEHVFRRGERVVVFTDYKSQGDFLWEVGRGGFRLADERGVQAVRSKLPEGGAKGVWFLSQPVDGKWHANPRLDGRMSRRSEEAVTRWAHLVLESDEAPEGLWLRYLARLPMEIRAIYSSGGRSWHALVVVDRESKADFDGLLRSHVKRILPVFGADPGAMTPVRLTRLPGCHRAGKAQRLIYLDPRPGAEAIIDLPARREL